MIDYLSIIKKYYEEGSQLYNLLITHCKQVADYSMGIIDAKKLDVDRDFVYEAAMLHDIGVFLTNAPGIYCVGKEPYLMHGILGAQLLRKEGLERHALVCERHIGAGLTKDEIIAQNLPLPAEDYLPQTLEEKLVCFSDMFFSKSKIRDAKSVEEVRTQMKHYGEGTMTRLEEMIDLFV